MEAARQMTSKQRGAIYAIAGKIGMDNDELHGMVEVLLGVESISTLTSHEAGLVIEALKRRAGQGPSSGWATQRQMSMIYALCREMGWVEENGAVNEKRLEGFVHKRFNIVRLQWLKMDMAGKVIDALKAMSKGGRGDRRTEGGTV